LLQQVGKSENPAVTGRGATQITTQFAKHVGLFQQKFKSSLFHPSESLPENPQSQPIEFGRIYVVIFVAGFFLEIINSRNQPVKGCHICEQSISS